MIFWRKCKQKLLPYLAFMNNQKITYREDLLAEHKKFIIEGLNRNAYLKKELGQDNNSFSFVIENNEGEIEAGIAGFNYYGCFYIDLLFVKETARNQGLGSALMQKAEELARKRECLFMAVNTMDFEAKPFYEKHGFKAEFAMKGFQAESVMHFLRKEL